MIFRVITSLTYAKAEGISTDVTKLDSAHFNEKEYVLDEVNITANRNTIPFEPRSPFVTSGIRLGSPALTTRGFCEEDMREVARIIACVLDAPTDETRRTETRSRVAALCAKYPLYE